MSKISVTTYYLIKFLIELIIFVTILLFILYNIYSNKTNFQIVQIKTCFYKKLN